MLYDLAEICSVNRIGEVGGERSFQWIIDLDLDVVNCGLRVLVELFINSDGIGKLDRREWCHMWNESIRYMWDVALLATNELFQLVTFFPQRNTQLTALRRSSHSNVLFSSSSCKPIAVTYSQIPMMASARVATLVSRISARTGLN